MKRSTVGQFLVVGLLAVSFYSFAEAEPGSERAVGTVQQSASDVAAIDQALHDRVKDGWYKLSIVPEADGVTLKGQVDTARTRDEVLSVARSVSSKPVRDQMSLKPTIPDAEIRAEITRALEREYPKLVQSVEVSVDQGIAHLKGALRNHREIDQVLATTVMQNGVKDVESELTIKGRQYGSSHKRSGKY